MRVCIEQIQIPSFGGPNEIPEIPSAVYEARIQRLRQRMAEANYDAVVVYADREHSANLSWLTGFDPRFEEAVFILTQDNQRTLIVGNECAGVLGALPIRARAALCQEFSLMGQDRSRSWDLKPLLKRAGLTRGCRCGLIGWKSLMDGRIEVPSYMVDLVSEACGKRPVNVNDLLMHPENGLRLFNEPEQIAFYEYAGVRTSESVVALLQAIRPGMRDFELARHFDSGGLPLSCHPMVSSGRQIPNGMASPGNHRVAPGDFFTTAFGVWGGLTCRAGLVTRGPRGFATASGRNQKRVIENYLLVVRAWYREIAAGAVAGEAWAAADRTRDTALYTFCVNPGHYISLDEWVSSPFTKGSSMKIPSSAALQQDIIPVGRQGAVCVNMEDGLVVADTALRRLLKERYPAMYRRCVARRKFMCETLGYDLSDDILPLSNTPGAYFPCLLDTGWVCRFEGT